MAGRATTSPWSAFTNLISSSAEEVHEALLPAIDSFLLASLGCPPAQHVEAPDGDTFELRLPGLAKLSTQAIADATSASTTG